MRKPEANVVPGEAATVARSFVFENRDTDGIDPSEVIDRMLAAGHGNEFPSEVRRKRLRTWTLQVFRRLKKHGWLEASGQAGWPPTAALRACRDPRSLSKRAPRRTEPRIPTRESQPRESQPREPQPREWGTSLMYRKSPEAGGNALAWVKHRFGECGSRTGSRHRRKHVLRESIRECEGRPWPAIARELVVVC